VTAVKLFDLTNRATRRGNRIYVPTPYNFYLGIILSKGIIKDIAAYRFVDGKFRRTNAVVVLEIIRGGRGYVDPDLAIGAKIERISVYHSSAFLHIAVSGRELSVIPHIFPTSFR